MYKQVRVTREVFGNGENLLVCGNVMKLPEEIRALAGKVQCVYADPPFMTGDHFDRSRPYGIKGWKSGSPAVKIPAFEDRFMSERQYVRLLNKIISGYQILGIIILYLLKRPVFPVFCFYAVHDRHSDLNIGIIKIIPVKDKITFKFAEFSDTDRFIA